MMTYVTLSRDALSHDALSRTLSRGTLSRGALCRYVAQENLADSKLLLKIEKERQKISSGGQDSPAKDVRARRDPNYRPPDLTQPPDLTLDGKLSN